MAHLHNIVDSDGRFIINPDTRVIEKESGEEKLVQTDHNSEKFAFSIPRLVDGHDMSLCDKVEVHYINISAKGEQSKDVYPVKDLAIDEWDEDKVVFSWLISANATKYAGTLNFLVRFTCLTGTEIEYVWNTDIYSGITVASGIDNGEAVVAEYSDVLEAWRAETLSEIETAKNKMLEEIERAADIVQTAGKSQTAVMSQWAVTGELENANERIDKTEKRITNIEQGVMADSFEVDDSVAYAKDVPTNALPYAAISKVGGMTRKCENLVNIRDWLSADYGTINTDGSLTFTTVGGANLVKEYTGAFPSGKYTVSNISGLTLFVQLAQGDYSNSVDVGALKSFTYDGTSYLRFVYVVQEANTTVTYKVMLNEGEALPYEPYFEGLRSASVTEVESVGANLFDYESHKNNNQTSIIKVIPNKTLYRNAQLGNSSMWEIYDNADALIGTFSSFNFTTSNPMVLPSNAAYIQSRDNIYTLTNFYLGYDSNTTYRPYVKHTLPIPAEVRPAHGINDDVYDYLDFGEKESVKRVGVVDMGTLNWSYVVSGANRLQTSAIANLVKHTLESDKANLLCEQYTSASTIELYRGNTGVGINTDGSLWVHDANYTDAASFKAAMQGVMLYYELAEPIVTDISDILPADNLIGVEGGGTITMVNEHEYAVPSEIIYQLKGVSV